MKKRISSVRHIRSSRSLLNKSRSPAKFWQRAYYLKTGGVLFLVLACSSLILSLTGNSIVDAAAKGDGDCTTLKLPDDQGFKCDSLSKQKKCKAYGGHGIKQDGKSYCIKKGKTCKSGDKTGYKQLKARNKYGTKCLVAGGSKDSSNKAGGSGGGNGAKKTDAICKKEKGEGWVANGKGVCYKVDVGACNLSTGKALPGPSAQMATGSFDSRGICKPFKV